ncbi:helicase associated domain-containing protein [Paracoccaceae bacterium]|jgi:hypothetical protein|nr:helicase associated domain-containing protein [Paracoccaceae bacterium]
MWEEGFSKLKQFCQREAECRVPQSHKENDFRLGIWVSAQRSKKDDLSPDEIERLDDLGFVWDPSKEDWEAGFSKLLKFFKREFSCRVPQSHKEDDYWLGNWVAQQRCKKDKLSLNKIKRLDDLGFVWDPFQEDWEQGFSAFQQFHKRERKSRVPARYKEDGYKLGTWVHYQRSQKNTLSPDQIKKLDALNFVWDPYKEDWEKGLGKLQRFRNRKGNCLVPTQHKEDDFNLGIWVRNQRRRKDTLSADRMQKLDALDFVWDVSKTKSASKND